MAPCLSMVRQHMVSVLSLSILIQSSSSHVEVINDISSQFDGSTTTFDLKINQDDDYTPWDGENSLLVETSGTYMTKSQYGGSGTQITFASCTCFWYSNVYQRFQECICCK